MPEVPSVSEFVPGGLALSSSVSPHTCGGQKKNVVLFGAYKSKKRLVFVLRSIKSGGWFQPAAAFYTVKTKSV
jgi:hypothetical protein